MHTCIVHAYMNWLVLVARGLARGTDLRRTRKHCPCCTIHPHHIPHPTLDIPLLPHYHALDVARRVEGHHRIRNRPLHTVMWVCGICKWYGTVTRSAYVCKRVCVCKRVEPWLDVSMRGKDWSPVLLYSLPHIPTSCLLFFLKGPYISRLSLSRS